MRKMRKLETDCPTDNVVKVEAHIMKMLGVTITLTNTQLYHTNKHATSLNNSDAPALLAMVQSI